MAGKEHEGDLGEVQAGYQEKIFSQKVVGHWNSYPGNWSHHDVIFGVFCEGPGVEFYDPDASLPIQHILFYMPNHQIPGIPTCV